MTAAVLWCGLWSVWAARASVPTTLPATPPEEITAHATISPWRPLFVGIDLCEISMKQPRPLEIRAVRVDLKEPSIRFFVTPPNGDAPGEVSGRQSTQFLTEFRCQLVINASFFGGEFKVGAPQDVVGLAISNGEMYSEPDKMAAILIDRSNRVRLAEPPFDLTEVYNAVAGDTLLVREGRNIVDRTRRDLFTAGLHPRTAAGLTRDERWLILMTVDGRQPGYSEGASKAETAEWMIRLGAWTALNLDGGHSTNLVMEGRDGRPVLINHPASPWLRPCATHLGIYARRLPGDELPPATQPADPASGKAGTAPVHSVPQTATTVAD